MVCNVQYIVLINSQYKFWYLCMNLYIIYVKWTKLVEINDHTVNCGIKIRNRINFWEFVVYVFDVVSWLYELGPNLQFWGKHIHVHLLKNLHGVSWLNAEIDQSMISRECTDNHRNSLTVWRCTCILSSRTWIVNKTDWPNNHFSF